jgi:hypothetical protein
LSLDELVAIGRVFQDDEFRFSGAVEEALKQVH